MNLLSNGSEPEVSVARMFRPFLWLGRFLHWVRLTVLNLLTLVVLIAIMVALAAHFFRSIRPIPEHAVLWLQPQGSLVYSKSNSWQDKVLEQIQPGASRHILLRHLVEVINHAASDPHIQILALDLQDFGGGSITQLLPVAHALQHFRATGKQIYAYAPNYSNANYLLAAQANHIFLPELGMALLQPFSQRGLYFHGLLQKLGITVYAFRQGKYKSAVEPFTRDDMSAAAAEETHAWLATWWQSYLEAIHEGRGIAKSSIEQYVSTLPGLLQQSQGNAAKLALDQKLITQIGDLSDFRKAVAQAMKEKPEHLAKVTYHSYLRSITPSHHTHAAAIAVVPIDGMLVPGNLEKQGVVAAGPTVHQLDQLRKDPHVKAVILQVDSPGGDVNAANDIRKAILRLRQAGKPVVVSMGTLGASGAYWLSTAADQIYAEPTTIAADIGVFVLFPDASGLLHKLDIGYSGVSSVPGSPALSPYAPLGTAEKQAFQAVVNHIYQHFVRLVAQSRGLSMKQAEQVSQGRAWSGADAYKLGLVNGLGGMNLAIEKAAQLAKLKPGNFAVRYLPKPTEKAPWTELRSFALTTLLAGSLGQDAGTRLGLSNSMEQALLLLHYSHPYGIFAYTPIDPKIH